MAFHQTGGCQCGVVRYEIMVPPRTVYCRHWTVCQTQTAAAFSMAAPGEVIDETITKRPNTRHDRQA